MNKQDILRYEYFLKQLEKEGEKLTEEEKRIIRKQFKRLYS